MTITVTEQGYLADPSRQLRRTDEVAADIAALQADPAAAVSTLPGRLVAGLAARRAGRGGTDHRPVLRQPARERRGDRLRRHPARPGRRPGAGRVDRRARRLRLVDGRPDHPGHDRRRPDAGGRALRLRRRVTGGHRALPRVGHVRTVPGRPPPLGGRRAPGSSTTSPRSSSASCGCSTAPTPCSRTPAASAATPPSTRPSPTPPAAVGSRRCGTRRHRTCRCPPTTSPAYRAALLDRYANPRIRHRLAQIVADGSTKIVVRTVPVIRAERDAGRVPLGLRHRDGRLDPAPARPGRPAERSRRRAVPGGWSAPTTRHAVRAGAGPARPAAEVAEGLGSDDDLVAAVVGQLSAVVEDQR